MHDWLRKKFHLKRHSHLDKTLEFTNKTVNDVSAKQIRVLSAGIAFYSILAFFPLVVALVALGTIFLNTENIEQVTRLVSEFLPGDLAGLLNVQLHHALGQNIDNIIVALVAITVSIFSVSGAVRSLMGSLNVIYEQRERRSFLKQRLIALLLAAGAILAMFTTKPVLLLSRDALIALGLSDSLQDLLAVGRWIILALAMILALNVLYRIGPSTKHHGRWPGLSRGILISTALWVGSSIVFFYYLSNLTNLTASYSLFAGMIGMMLWFNLTSFAVLLGADIDHHYAKY